MIKTSLKSFFTNLIYTFVPMGVVYLFIIIAAYSFLSSGINEISALVKGIAETTNSALQPEIDKIEEYFQGEFDKIDWDRDVFTVIKQIADTDWIANTLRGFVDFLEENYAAYADEISTLIEISVARFKAYFALAASICVMGISAGYLLCRVVVRRKLARRTFWKMVIAYVCEGLIASAMLLLAGWISFKWSYGIYIAALLLIILFGALSLSVAWLVQNRKTVSFRRVVNFKNTAGLLVSNILILALIGLFSGLVSALTNSFIGLLISIPVFLYGVSIVSVNAEAYVAELARSVETLTYEREERNFSSLPQSEGAV